MSDNKRLLALAMIFKNEVNEFRRIMATYSPLFDEIVIAVDDKIQEFKEIADLYPKKNIKILPYTWQKNFSHKRNFVSYHVTCDYYFRLDADDAINPRSVNQIRDIAEQAEKNDVSIVYGYYNYSRDQWGNVNAAHWREVIIKNTPNLYWNKKIHENILPKNIAKHKIDMNDQLIIEHMSSEEKIHESLLRNISYLLEEYKEDGEKCDPRTLVYLGRMLHGIGAFDKSVYFLEKHIATSGWDEDRYMSWCQISDCYRQMNRNDEAIAAAFEALSERPDYPDAYLRLHDVYFNMEDWVKAEEWGRQGLMKPVPKTFMMQDLSSYQWRPVLSMSFCLFKLGKFEEALKLLNIAKKDVPTLDFIKTNEGMYQKAVEHKKFMEKYLGVVNYLKDHDEEKKIISLLEAAPKDLQENELVIKLKQHFLPPKTWSENSVCIFALNTLDDWSPKSAEKGIGGSEEAIIHLSRELVKLGMEVTVFNNCGEQAGVYEGVKYCNVIDFNPKDTYNILISWRSNIFENTIEAKKRIVWLHDMPNINFEEDNIKRVDRIVVLSKYHASLLPDNVPPEKVFVTTNGINAEDFIGLEAISREDHRVIYASSYNRGLEQLLEMWPEVRQAVPDASLHIYYGWDTYDAFVRQGFTKETGFKAKMEKLMQQPGVTHHGRIGHKELLQEYAKASIMAYPCTYAGEINCIALTKAIACGCYVVSNDFAVMKERNIFPAVKDEDFKGALIFALLHCKSNVDCGKYIQDNSWAAVAKDWKENLFQFDIPVVYQERLDWMRSNVDKDAKIVDIGSNKGHLFAGWNRSKITSVDIDEYDLPNFVRADATKPLPFKDKEFDIAVLGEIVEHTDNPVDVIREAMRICNKLIITVPWECKWTSELLPFATVEDRMKLERVGSRLELAKLANPAKEFHQDDNFDHLWHKQWFTADSMKEILKKADIVDYRMVELRNGNWVNLGIICG